MQGCWWGGTRKRQLAQIDLVETGLEVGDDIPLFIGSIAPDRVLSAESAGDAGVVFGIVNAKIPKRVGTVAADQGIIATVRYYCAGARARTDPDTVVAVAIDDVGSVAAVNDVSAFATESE